MFELSSIGEIHDFVGVSYYLQSFNKHLLSARQCTKRWGYREKAQMVLAFKELAF